MTLPAEVPKAAEAGVVDDVAPSGEAAATAGLALLPRDH